MPWPAPNEYQDAVQNPKIAFRDPVLQSGKIKLNNLRLPKVASGNFACVFEIQDGMNSFAIRCFLREVTDHQRRYDMLSQHLANFRLPSLVRFEYIKEGIRIQQKWFPVVKMDWVDGESLASFVERNINNIDTLRNLAADWRGLCAGLRGAHMAHGDLQHGNIMVSSGGLIKLVDYDPMFIPALQGSKCPELGHPNYAHPKRKGEDYDENLDNFSAFVIYLSLLALAANPSLWNKFYMGDNLIFTKEDYMNPDQSDCFKMLEGSSDPAVRNLVIKLKSFSSGPSNQVPDLESQLQNIQLTNPSSNQLPVKPRARSPVIKTNSQPVSGLFQCQNCGEYNEPGLLYCKNKNCASILDPVSCKDCGAMIPRVANFCRVCGAKQ